MASPVAPSVGSPAFTCPHCGAYAHQTWFKPLCSFFGKDEEPVVPDPANMRAAIAAASSEEEVDFIGLLGTLKPFMHSIRSNGHIVKALYNLHIAQCYSCKGLSIWCHDQLIWPSIAMEIKPNPDMPPQVRRHFEEAAAIVSRSPRGAAALLRLCVQLLCIELQLPGKNINDDIGELVKRGLDPRIQQALDIVRVIGNNAVHPGTIDLDDNRQAANNLFALVNLIVEHQISRPKHIDELYASLPEGARIGIEQRNAKALGKPPISAP